MAYASQFTGGDDHQRRSEADKLLKIIHEDVDKLTSSQSKFVEQMSQGGYVSGKQLLWLRDIKDSLI
jgi:hypothetical protein